MSLIDTIKGAREEAETGRAELAASDADKEGAPAKNEAGFVRRSPSRAKPSREAAAGVRVVSGKSKPADEMTKEEKKAEKRRQREKEDRRYAVAQMLQEADPDYQHRHKIWWRILIAGFALMVLSMLLYALVTSQGETTPIALAAAALGAMVLAYVAIIAAFIYDWTKIRPIRQACEQRAASMTEKRINRMLRERDQEQK